MDNTNTVRYQMIQSTAYVEDSGLITTYGISCRADANASRSAPGDLEAFRDVSTVASLVEKLVDRLNAYSADPLHLKDILYDFLP